MANAPYNLYRKSNDEQSYRVDHHLSLLPQVAAIKNAEANITGDYMAPYRITFVMIWQQHVGFSSCNR